MTRSFGARPTDADYFDANLSRFMESLDARQASWASDFATLRGKSIIAYHNQWPYFEDAFGLQIIDFLEPKPGIPPTPSQLAHVIGVMEQQDIEVIIISPYYQQDAAELVARKTGAQVVDAGYVGRRI